jgi:hypothetical protein
MTTWNVETPSIERVILSFLTQKNDKYAADFRVHFDFRVYTEWFNWFPCTTKIWFFSALNFRVQRKYLFAFRVYTEIASEHEKLSVIFPCSTKIFRVYTEITSVHGNCECTRKILTFRWRSKKSWLYGASVYLTLKNQCVQTKAITLLILSIRSYLISYKRYMLSISVSAGYKRQRLNPKLKV